MANDLLVALAIVLAGCSSRGSPDSVANGASAIVGGQETPPCAWPTTVGYVGWTTPDMVPGTANECTATLIHPRVVSLAAHCLDGGFEQRIYLGDAFGRIGDTNVRAAYKSVPVDHCTRREGGIDAGEDYGFCILSTPVDDVPIIPVLFGCEEAILREGTPVVIVGFGSIDESTSSPNDMHKRWVETSVSSFPADRKSLFLGDAGHTNCFGDSGGPAFVKLDDGTWRVFGAASTSQFVDGHACASPGRWAYIPSYVAWTEQQSGIDITPCHDAQTATWSPGPDCRDVPLNPEVAGGTWSSMCNEGQRLSGPLATCGAPTDAGPSVRVQRDATQPDSDAGHSTFAQSPHDDGSGCSCSTATSSRADLLAFGALVVGLFRTRTRSRRTCLGTKRVD